MKIVRFGQNAILKKVCKILLTFVDAKVYIIQGCWTRQQQIDKEDKILRAFVERAKTESKKVEKSCWQEKQHMII